MKLEPQFHTLPQLLRAFADIAEACVGTKVRPEECWKYEGTIGADLPSYVTILTGVPANYEIAIAIVEDEKVWRGSKLWRKNGNSEFVVHKIKKCNDGKWIAYSEYHCGAEYWSNLTWIPPSPVKNNSILKTKVEIQTGYDRQKWAEGLILQMPTDHDGRNSWLLNYGTSEQAKILREHHPRKPKWDESTQSAETITSAPPSPNAHWRKLFEAGEKLQTRFNQHYSWVDLTPKEPAELFSAVKREFRLKPATITIEGEDLVLPTETGSSSSYDLYFDGVFYKCESPEAATKWRICLNKWLRGEK